MNPTSIARLVPGTRFQVLVPVYSEYLGYQELKVLLEPYTDTGTDTGNTGRSHSYLPVTCTSNW